MVIENDHLTPDVVNKATGTSLFETLITYLQPISALIMALGIIALLITSLRLVMSPTDQQLASSLTQIRRILIITVFIGLLGTIICWVCELTGVCPPGTSSLESIFRW